MHIYDGDDPIEEGLFLVYVNVDFTNRYAGRKLLIRHDNQWFYPGSDQRYRGHIYQCVGPFPALELFD